MTPELGNRIKELFATALEQEPTARDAFLRQACLDDYALRSQVDKLLYEHEQTGSVLTSRASAVVQSTAARLFADREVVAERFRIVRFLGQGGMGEVYEAEDLALGDRVALKTVRPEISKDAVTLARFRQEIHLARKITHPNVCRIFDLASHKVPPLAPEEEPSEILLLTMELLEGETLAARLQRSGRLNAEEALPIACQMAEALDAAHRVHIIHRDFKSANVLLVGQRDGTTRAVVTDFGLARRVAGDDSAAVSLSSTGHLLGTPSYMAPEQLEGQDASPSSDIYSLGVVLYEMITGTRPFESDSPFVAAFRRLHQPAPSPCIHVSGLEPRWESVILRCLERGPDRRFGSASEVASVLSGRADERQAVLARPDPGSTRRYRRAAGWLAAVFLGLLLIYGSFSWRGRTTATIQPGSAILLTDVTNSTQDPDLDSFTEVLRSQLGQSPHFRVLENSEIREALQRMVRPGQRLDAETAREVALRSGVPLVLFGSLSRLSQDYTLNLKVEKVGSRPGRSVASWLRTWNVASKRDLLATVREGSTWIRNLAGETAKDLAENDFTPEESTTDSWEAWRLFAEAQRRKAQDKDEEALLLLKEAVEKDPQFALAYMRLGDIQVSLFRYGEGYQYWQKALEMLKVRHVSRREEYRIKGVYAIDTGDHATAERVFSTFAVHYPHDWLPWFYRAHPLMMMGRVEEALDSLQEAERRAPRAYYIPVHLANYNLILGRWDQLPGHLDKLRKLGQPSLADAIAGAAAYLQGDFQQAEALLVRLKDAPDRYAKATGPTLLACLFGEMGRYRDALRVLKDGIASDLPAGRTPARADKLMALAYLYSRLGERESSRDASLQAVDLDPSWRRFARTGTLLARQGFVVEARQLLPRLDQKQDWPYLQVATHRLKGEILLAQGKKPEALAEFRQAAARDAPSEPREYLARALALSGLPAEALPLYEKIVQRPGLIWRGAGNEFPGFWTDALFQYSRLGLLMGKAKARNTLEQYLNRRSRADPGVREIQEAQKLLSDTIH